MAKLLIEDADGDKRTIEIEMEDGGRMSITSINEENEKTVIYVSKQDCEALISFLKQQLTI